MVIAMHRIRRGKAPKVEAIKYVPGQTTHSGVTKTIKKMIDDGKENRDIVNRLLPKYMAGGRPKWHAKRYLRVYVKHVRRAHEVQQAQVKVTSNRKS